MGWNGGGGSGSDATPSIPIAAPAGTVLETDPNPIAGGVMTGVLVFPANTAAVAIKIAGDEFPRILLASDSNAGLYFGDGTYDPHADGARVHLINGDTLALSSTQAGELLTQRVQAPAGTSLNVLADETGGGSQVIISDNDAQAGGGTTNGMYWQTGAADGDQFVLIKLGAAGEFNWSLSANGETALPADLIVAGNVGFYGQPAAPQPAAPVTLGDVIAALQALGLVAT